MGQVTEFWPLKHENSLLKGLLEQVSPLFEKAEEMLIFCLRMLRP